MLLAGLSTGNKVGLAVMGAIFISFALVSSFVIPKRRPAYPGKNGLSVFVIVCIALFLAMVTSVIVFGAESESSEANSVVPNERTPAVIMSVTETEFSITLPSSASHAVAGSYTFRVRNEGKLQHDLVVSGAGVNDKTPLINPGGTASLKVKLGKGSYTLYCSVPGHRAAGMVAKLNLT